MGLKLFDALFSDSEFSVLLFHLLLEVAVRVQRLSQSFWRVLHRIKTEGELRCVNVIDQAKGVSQRVLVEKDTD